MAESIRLKEVVGGDIELNHRVFVLYCTLGRKVGRDSIRVRSSLEHLLVEVKLGRQPCYLGLKVHCSGLGSRSRQEGRLGWGTGVGWKVDIGMNWEEEAAGCIWYDTTESLLLQQICFFL